jgi:hypothetical protein
MIGMGMGKEIEEIKTPSFTSKWKQKRVKKGVYPLMNQEHWISLDRRAKNGN